MRRSSDADNIGLRYEARNDQRHSKPFPWIHPIEHYDAETDLVFRVQLTHGELVDIRPSDHDLERIVSASARYLMRRLIRRENGTR